MVAQVKAILSFVFRGRFDSRLLHNGSRAVSEGNDAVVFKPAGLTNVVGALPSEGGSYHPWLDSTVHELLRTVYLLRFCSPKLRCSRSFFVFSYETIPVDVMHHRWPDRWATAGEDQETGGGSGRGETTTGECEQSSSCCK